MLPTLVFVGLVTFERVLQTGLEDYSYARRIARLRGYYFDNAPELVPYLLSVAPSERMRAQGLWGVRFQGFRTIAGMVAVITSVLAGTTAGLIAALASNHSLAAAISSGVAVAGISLVALMRYQRAGFAGAQTAQLFIEIDEAAN